MSEDHFSGIDIHVLHFMPCGVHERCFFFSVLSFVSAFKIENNKHNSLLINNRQTIIMKAICYLFDHFMNIIQLGCAVFIISMPK